jgi:hypothetical protein
VRGSGRCRPRERRRPEPAQRATKNTGPGRPLYTTTEVSATGLRFRTGEGSCVGDAYTTSTHTRYIEIACLVKGRHASSVIVGAAPIRSWAQEHMVIEQAISALTT